MQNFGCKCEGILGLNKFYEGVSSSQRILVLLLLYELSNSEKCIAYMCPCVCVFIYICMDCVYVYIYICPRPPKAKVKLQSMKKSLKYRYSTENQKRQYIPFQ